MGSAADQTLPDTEIDPRWTAAMFRSLAENVMMGIYVLQGDRFHYVNDALASMLGYTRAEMLDGLSLFDVVAGDRRAEVQAKLALTLQGPEGRIHYERKAQRKNGVQFDVEVFGVRMELEGRAVVVGVMLDITRRRKAEEAAQLTSLVYHYSSEAMVVADANGVIITVNPAFSRITGYSLNEVAGKRLNILSSGRHDTAFYERMWASIIETGNWQGDIWNKRKNGEEYAERLTINTSYNDDGSVRCRVGLFSDITEKKLLDEQVWRQANFDHLTGLPNRKRFHDRLNTKIKRAAESGTDLALLYLDLDDFKDINDTLGHSCGDEVLRIVASRLSRCVRKTDTIARLGGDEFCIILRGAGTTEVVDRICEKIIQTLGEPYVLGADVGRVSASVGVAFYPRDATRADDLINFADLAMYASKQMGRNRYSYFTAGIRQEAEVRRQLLRDLAGARQAGQLRLHFQPLIDLASGRLVKAEALVRWEHPEHGLIGPNAFIPHAEDSGLIISIGDWVFRAAAAQVAQWRAQYMPELCVAINVSPAQFRHEGLQPADWLAQMQSLGLPGESVVVEITERLLMDAAPNVVDKLLAFRDSGVQVALDDFGTGYSSLSYLRKFHIDYIKIDQSFVRNLDTSPDDQAVCEAIVVMAHRLGLKVVAEGVETAVQCQILRDMGCDTGQGYLFSKPLPPEQFVELLRDPMATICPTAEAH